MTIDLSNPNFENVEYWLDQIASNAKKDMPVILAGTKKDLKSDLDFDTFKSFAQSKELPFIETSARNNENVDKTFELLLNEVLYRDEGLAPKNKSKEGFNVAQKQHNCCLS